MKNNGRVKKSVLIAVPNTGWIHKNLTFVLLKLLVDGRYNTRIILPTHQPVDNNRNIIIRDVLKGSYDYLLMMDSDNPPTNNPFDLVELDKDVMIFPTPQWHCSAEDLALGKYPIFWNCMDEVDGGWKEHNPKIGLQKIGGAGSGCMLISRRVLEKVKKPFEREWDEDGIVVEGSDFRFCRKAREAGFDIWCHYDYPCMHFKELELIETIKAFTNYQENKVEVGKITPNFTTTLKSSESFHSGGK